MKASKYRNSYYNRIENNRKNSIHRWNQIKIDIKINIFHSSIFSLKNSIIEKDNNIDSDLEHIEKVFGQISDLQDRINSLLEEISELYVFVDDQQHIETKLNQLKTRVAQAITDSKQLVQQTQQEYNKSQGFVPSDVAQELTALEFATERLQTAMDDKERDFKRAKTVRGEYLNGVDYIQTWLHQAELRIQDRSVQPTQFREVLNKIAQELTDVQDKLENVKQNGHVIIEKSRNDDEKDLIRNTVDQLVQQVEQLRSLLDEKRHQVGNSLDAWSRFMQLYQIVMTWAAEKRTFLASPLNVTTLPEARQKTNDYLNAVKSIKPIVKNLSEMDKELDKIAEVSSIGDLRGKLVEAEEAKVEIEAILLKRVRLTLPAAFFETNIFAHLFCLSLIHLEYSAARNMRRMGAMREETEGNSCVD